MICPTTKTIVLGLLGLLVMFPCSAAPDDVTPHGNLAGIVRVHERIIVNLNLRGAEEFRVDPEEIKHIVKSTLHAAGVEADGSGLGTPMVAVFVDGESTGGGGARYRVELLVRATITSPFAENRSAQVIFWRDSAAGEESMRYDPASKGLIKPTGPINERVYSSLREVASRLAGDIRKANTNK